MKKNEISEVKQEPIAKAKKKNIKKIVSEEAPKLKEPIQTTVKAKNERKQINALSIIAFIITIMVIILCNNAIFKEIRERNEINATLLEEIKKSNETINTTIENINDKMATYEQLEALKKELIAKINSTDARNLIIEKYNSIMNGQKNINTNIDNNEVIIKTIQETIDTLIESINNQPNTDAE